MARGMAIGLADGGAGAPVGAGPDPLPVRAAGGQVVAGGAQLRRVDGGGGGAVGREEENRDRPRFPTYGGI